MAAPPPPPSGRASQNINNEQQQIYDDYYPNVENLTTYPSGLLNMMDNNNYLQQQQQQQQQQGGGYLLDAGVAPDYLPETVKQYKNRQLQRDAKREDLLTLAGETEREDRYLEMLQREERKMLVAKQRLQAERKRRIRQRLFAFFLTLLAFIKTILIASTMVKPVPQFALEGNLFYVQSRQADQYTKRDVLPSYNVTTFHKLNEYAFPVVSTVPAKSELLSRRLGVNPRQQKKKVKPVSADHFVAFWFGAMGACLQRASGAIICGGGLSTDFEPLYKQSRLPDDIVKLLPKSTGTAPAGYLAGCLLNGVFIVYLSLVSNSPKLMWTPLRPTSTWERRYQFTVGTMSLFAIGGAAAFTVSTIQLRNKFSGAAQSIPGLNTEYIAKYDSGFQNLYGGCIIGGLVILGCIWLTWWVREREAEDMLVERQAINEVFYQGQPGPSATEWDARERIEAQSVVGSR